MEKVYNDIEKTLIDRISKNLCPICGKGVTEKTGTLEKHFKLGLILICNIHKKIKGEETK